jgi:hypothetical protein
MIHTREFTNGDRHVVLPLHPLWLGIRRVLEEARVVYEVRYV